MCFQAWKPSPSAWVVQMRSVSNTSYSQAANTFRQLCGHLEPWCWMRSWEDCGCGHAPVMPDRLSEEAALPPVACHKTDLLPNLPPPPFPRFNPFQFVRRARRNVPLSAVGHAMRLAGELHRPLASRMTPSLTHDVTTPSICVWKNGLSRS